MSCLQRRPGHTWQKVTYSHILGSSLTLTLSWCQFYNDRFRKMEGKRRVYVNSSQQLTDKSMKLHVRFFKHLIPLKGKYIYNLLPISITFLSFASYVQNVADNLLFGGVGSVWRFPAWPNRRCPRHGLLYSVSGSEMHKTREITSVDLNQKQTAQERQLCTELGMHLWL